MEVIKYDSDRGIYNVCGRPVDAYTHTLPGFALPVYHALSAVAHIINLRLFFILVWLLSVSALIYYYSGTKRTKYVLANPLEFVRWGEIAAINLLNIVAISRGKRHSNTNPVSIHFQLKNFKKSAIRIIREKFLPLEYYFIVTT